MKRPHRRTLISAVSAAAIATLVAATLGPTPPHQPRRVSGESALAERTLTALSGAQGLRSVSVALIEDGGARVTYAGLDQPGGSVTERTAFEIGSVTKALTGMLLAETVERGEVEPTAPLDSIAPGLGSAGLEDLSTHHSGLPRLPISLGTMARGWADGLAGGNPYSESPAQVMAQARAAGSLGGADFAYSNLGAATLGHLLADRQATSYASLLRVRVLAPLRMDQTVIATSRAELPPTGRSVARPMAAVRKSGSARGMPRPGLVFGRPLPT